MENFKDQLQQLFDKQEWTNEEKEWLLNYLESADTEELKALMLEQFEREKSGRRTNWKQSEKILALVHQRIGIDKRAGRVINGKIKLLQGLAAASVIGLLVIGGYFAFNRKAPKAIAITNTPKKGLKNDVQPGSNKAVLTLANGSTIVLNDEQNGEVAAQGNTKVLKMESRLTYQPSDSAEGKAFYNTISTPRSGQYQVVLADGSSVWLNAASSLRFPTAFVGKERRVEVSGEAYFEVAKNKTKPFVVSVNGAEVQVLGTHFNVKAYSDEAVLKTTLLEGSVKFAAGNRTVTLKPGQQSQRTENGEIKVLRDVDIDRVVAWKNGYFDFNGEGLEMIAKQLARWYDVEIIGTDRINDRFYAEIPRNTNLSDALHALELTGKVHFTINGKKVFVKP